VPRPKNFRYLSGDEYQLVRSHAQIFVNKGCVHDFISCVGWGIDFDWANLKVAIEQVLNGLPDDQLFSALDALVHAIFWGVRETADDLLSKDLGRWMLDQLIKLPDLGKWRGLGYHMEEVLKRVGRVPLSWLPGAIERRRLLEEQRGEGEVRALTHDMRLHRFVKPIDEGTDITPEISTSVNRLLGFVLDGGNVGYYMYEVLRDIDPLGRVVPSQASLRFVTANDQKERYRIARIAGAFTLGSTAWREIAKPVLELAAETHEARISLFSALTEHRRAWSGRPGEVPAVFISAVDSAQQQLEVESDETLRPFWEWRLDTAKSELRDQQEYAKEERGE
jgi:hypothetical protein